MKRSAVFVHYDKNDKIDDYVIYYLKSLNEVCDTIIFVTTSNASENELTKIRNLCEKIIKRENIGYDFMSYKIGLQNLDIDKYDEVIICNDSVYGPFFPFSNIFKKMQTIDCDFWGITENYDIAYHIQSYFVVFRKKVLQSDYFKNFWENITVLHDKSDIINNYEVGLSQFLLNSGFYANAYVSLKSLKLLEFLKLLKPDLFFTFRVLFNKIFFKNFLWESIKELWEKLSLPFSRCSHTKKRTCKFWQKLNPTHFFWKYSINKCDMPFIKVELLRDNPRKINVKDFESVIKKISVYDTTYIKKHLERIKCAKKKFKLCD